MDGHIRLAHKFASLSMEEFTQTTRTFLPPKICFDSAYKSVSLGYPTQLDWLLHEACIRLDVQQQEIKRLKELGGE